MFNISIITTKEQTNFSVFKVKPQGFSSLEEVDFILPSYYTAKFIHDFKNTGNKLETSELTSQLIKCECVIDNDFFEKFFNHVPVLVTKIDGFVLSVFIQQGKHNPIVFTSVFINLPSDVELAKTFKKAAESTYLGIESLVAKVKRSVFFAKEQSRIKKMFTINQDLINVQSNEVEYDWDYYFANRLKYAKVISS